MTDQELVAQCIARGDIKLIYKTRRWEAVRNRAMANQQQECQRCKEKGRYRRARIVHHVKPLKKYPYLALSEWYTDEEGKEQRQLLALCFNCHEIIEGRIYSRKDNEEFPERW